MTDAPAPRARSATPAGPAVAEHDDDAAGEQEVRRAQDAVEGRLPGAVAVVERALGRASFTAMTGHRSRSSAAMRAHAQHAGRRLLRRPEQSPRRARGRACVDGADEVGAVVERDVAGAGPRASATCVGVGRRVLPAHGVDLAPRRTPPGRRPRRPGWTAGWRALSAVRAPPAASVRTRFAVSAVTCRHAADRDALQRALGGEALADRAAGPASARRPTRSGPRPPPRAPGRRWRSRGGRARSTAVRAARLLVAVVVRLVRALDRDADVGGLLVGERRELHAERVEVQPGDLLVEVLGQDVDLLLVVLGLREQLDLGDRLVREASST